MSRGIILLCLRRSAGIFFLLLLTPLGQAEESVSPAEAAAQAALQPIAAEERLTSMCNHILLYGSDDQKAQLLAAVGGKTCAEAAIDGTLSAPASSN